MLWERVKRLFASVFSTSASFSFNLKSQKNTIKNNNTSYGNNAGGNNAGNDVNITQLVFNGEKQKNDSILLFRAAFEDLEYNGSGVGNPRVPFSVDAIRKLLDYDGLGALNAEDKEIFRKYHKDATTCNGRDGGSREVKPGNVQGQREYLKTILKKYIDKIGS